MTAATAGCASGWSSRGNPSYWRSRAPSPCSPSLMDTLGSRAPTSSLPTSPPKRGGVSGAGTGTKGPRSYDWARVRLARLQLTAAERQWEHWLLVRRSRQDPTELAYYVVFAPAGTSLRTLARVAGQRWRIEQSFELAKGEVGLDHYEVRRWDGWYRHMTLAMFALAYLAVLRAHLQAQESAQESARHHGRTTSQTGKTQVAKGGRTSSRSI